MRKIIKTSIILLIISILGFFIIFVPVSDQHYSLSNYHHQTHTNIENTSFKLPKNISSKNASLSLGYAHENIMFHEPLDLAGYGFRGRYQSVHDSLKVSTLYLKNQDETVIILSLDLLIFPPEIVAHLKEELAKIGEDVNHVFFSATHTHTGTGGWAKPPLGWLFGNYKTEVVQFMTEQIIASIQKARQNIAPVKVGFQEIRVPEYLSNRLTKDKQIYDKIKTIWFKKQNGKSILWSVYSAHPTCINSKMKIVSRDYPGFLVDDLEKNSEIEFALFSAGSVGSHAPKSILGLKNMAKSQEIGENLSHKIQSTAVSFDDCQKLKLTKTHLEVGNLSPRISESWRLRPFIFDVLMNQQTLNLSVLRLGNQIICGVPADFSGELMPTLDNFAQKRGLNLLITSFNGGYLGYIVPQKRLSIGRDETREMNWLNNYGGEYFVDLIAHILLKN